MNKNFKKALTLGCATLLVSGALSVSAANLTKKVEAVYNNIKVTYNGNTQTPQNEPFLIDGSVYVSLRDAGQITNNIVNWDSANKTVQITSKTPSTSVSETELANKNLEIATLKNQVAKLEAKLAQYEEAEANKPTLDAKGLAKVEELLVKEYGEEYKVEWDFNLDYNSKKELLELTVSYDSDDDKSDFNKISSNGNLQTFLEDLCKEIRDHYDGIEITGEVYDDGDRATKGTFSYSTKNRFSYSSYLTADDLYDLGEEITDDWGNFPSLDTEEFDDDIYIQMVELKAEDDNQTIIAEIYTNLIEADKEAWNSFKDSASVRDRRAITDYCREIASFIKEETNASTVDLVFYTDHEKLIAKFQDNKLSLERMGR